LQAELPAEFLRAELEIDGYYRMLSRDEV